MSGTGLVRGPMRWRRASSSNRFGSAYECVISDRVSPGGGDHSYRVVKVAHRRWEVEHQGPGDEGFVAVASAPKSAAAAKQAAVDHIDRVIAVLSAAVRSADEGVPAAEIVDVRPGLSRGARRPAPCCLGRSVVEDRRVWRCEGCGRSFIESSSRR